MLLFAKQAGQIESKYWENLYDKLQTKKSVTYGTYAEDSDNSDDIEK